MIDHLYSLEKKAIKQALLKNWLDAILSNSQILKINPCEINALNRLAKAQIETNQAKEAKKNLQKVLSLDSTNSVAQTNLKKLSSISKEPASLLSSSLASNTTNINFIEEPGKTKVVNLVNLGNPTVINQLQVGQEVFTKATARKIKIVNQTKQYLGCLPDDLSLILCHYFKLGNKYQLLIKSISQNQVKIFIRETRRTKRLKGMASFQPEKDSYPLQFSPHRSSEPPLKICDPHLNQDENDH